MRLALAAAGFVLVGCSSYMGTSRSTDSGELSGPGWMAVQDVPYIAQREEKDCGAAALAMILGHWKRAEGLEEVRAACPPGERGITAGALRDYARRLGFESYVFEGDFGVFAKELAAGRPFIVGMIKPTLTRAVTHFEVVIGYHPERRQIVTLDPSLGTRVNDEPGFLAEWNMLAEIRARNPELADRLLKEDPSFAAARRVTIVVIPPKAGK